MKLEYKDNKGKGILPIPAKEYDPRDEDRSDTIPGRNHHHSHIPYPRLEFPTFTGDELRIWVENCEQYFEVYQIPHHQWLNIATMHLIGLCKDTHSKLI